MTKLLEDLLSALLSSNVNLKGRRVINAGNSKNNQDYITRFELQQRVPVTTFGTLSPDERPSNSSKNDIFISTDFLHMYYYTGSAWLRLGASDYVGWFRSAPGTGWHLCDGTTGVSKSNDDGTISTITVPTLNAKVVARFDSAYSGPASTAAVAPTGVAGVTSSEGSAVAVDNTLAGSTVNVAAHPHIHAYTPTINADGHDKLMDGLPYIRL